MRQDERRVEGAGLWAGRIGRLAEDFISGSVSQGANPLCPIHTGQLGGELPSLPCFGGRSNLVLRELASGRATRAGAVGRGRGFGRGDRLRGLAS